MRAHLSLVFVLMVLLSTVSAVAYAQPAQSFRELAARRTLNRGDRVEVKDSAGGTTRGVFAGFASDEMLLHVGPSRLEARFLERDVQRIRRSGGHATAWGAVIGVASAVALTAAAAESYGNNEGGRFCGNCFLVWGILTVPAGAGIGAGIGKAIDRLNRSTLFTAPSRGRSIGAAPFVSRRGGGVVVSVTF